jgi:predicted ATPase/signal transduction histidine kinase
MKSILDYTISEVVARDGKMIIYRGVRERDCQTFLLKMFQAESPNSGEIAQLQHEYQMTKELNIPGIIAPWELKICDRNLVLIYQNFPGQPLKQYLLTREITVEEFLKIAIQISKILHEIHDREIIHKNLTPQSIWIEPTTGKVKITDFSLTSPLSEEDRVPNPLESFKEKLFYISPEQTGRMNRAIDYRTDFYSLGIVFYQMLAGSLPFQTTDPMQLIHCHIAKKPVSLHQLNAKIPLAISNIVDKLLCKTAEERYQSSYGIELDLENCLTQWENQGKIEPFIIASQDISRKLRISQKLYGREREIATLLNTFESVSQGKSQLLLISGLAGIGKTALVNEIHKPIIHRQGYFVSGKFSQLKRDIPYYFLIQAFRELILQILTESEARIQTWKEKLLEALGSNGQVIIDVIPEVELIIGKQPNVPQLSTPESQNRFNSVLQKFIEVFSQQDHPLVLFFDDLQWSDLASLNLIHLLLTQSNVKHLLIVGTYRNNEVSDSHPLMMALKKLEALEIKVDTLMLQPLNIHSVTQLIVDTFNCQSYLARPLAKLILEKTHGNPFFINQLLKSFYKEKLIKFNFKKRYWQWDLEKIESLQIADNVAEFMVDKIKQLSAATRKTLKIAACLGTQFNLNTLAFVTRKNLIETANSLWEALDKGLILPSGNYYKIATNLERSLPESESNTNDKFTYHFIHDRVQQAAYSLLSEKQKQVIHLKHGKGILTKTSPGKLEENIFNIVNHLNVGSTLIKAQAEREQLARLNFIAGKKAKRSTAYEAALNYFETALILLPEDSWKSHYQLSLSLHIECSECEYLSGKFERAEQRFNLILDRTKTKTGKAKVYILKITLYTNIGKLSEAIEIGLECLRLFKIHIDLSKLHRDIAKEIKRVQAVTTNRKIEELYNLPDMRDKNSIVIMNLLMSLAAPTYFANLELWTLLMLKTIARSLRYGNSEVSSFAYSAYGLIIGSAFGDYKTGYEFGQLALKVNEKFGNVTLWSKVYFMVGAFINHWTEHIKESFSFLRKSFQYGNETGDPSFGAYSVNIIACKMYFQGYPLDRMAQELKGFIDYVEKTKNIYGIYFHKLLKQAILSLQGLTACFPSLNDDNFDEDSYYKDIKRWNLGLHLSFYSILKMQLLYLFGDCDRALVMAKESEKLIGFSFGLWRTVEHYFYYSLTLASLYLKADRNTQAQYWKILLENQKKFKLWSDNCSENFLHKYLLISAEMARISNQDLEAMEFYDRAIASARENEYYLNENLSNELAAKFYLSKGKDKIAGVYLRDAYYGYLRWGGMTKISHLEQNYPQFLSNTIVQKNAKNDNMTHSNAGESQSASVGKVLSLGVGEGNRFLSFDLSTILKAYQTISSEIALGKLLESLMKIVIENAGAQKGFLILEKEGKWLIEAESSVESEKVTTLRSIPIDFINSATQTTLLSVAIVNYVIRTYQNVVFGNATREKQFLADPYLVKTQPKSILCIPLIYQGKLCGLLYLENNLTTDAFTPDRVEVLKMLSSQAAISIEHSRLYERLEEYSRTLEIKVEERTREIKQKNEELANTLQTLRKTQARIIAQEKLASLGTLTAGIAHEIKNPLNFVNNFAELSIELAQELIEEIELQKDNLDSDSLVYIQEILQDLSQNAQKINEHGKRADKIVHGMLMHSRGESASRQQTDINALLAEAVNLAYHGMRAKDSSFCIAIETRYDESLEPIYAIPQDISRVFLNIINNACYAVHQKKIKARNNLNSQEQEYLPFLVVSTQNLSESIEIRIRDNGDGIPPEIADKIFTPFFTTKPTGEGTGLGLSISHDIIVQAHQGDICIETESDRYTEFIITLPKTVVPDQGRSI